MFVSAEFAKGFTLIGAGMCRCDLCGKEIIFAYPAIVGHRKGRQHREAVEAAVTA